MHTTVTMWAVRDEKTRLPTVLACQKTRHSTRRARSPIGQSRTGAKRRLAPRRGRPDRPSTQQLAGDQTTTKQQALMRSEHKERRQIPPGQCCDKPDLRRSSSDPQGFRMCEQLLHKHTHITIINIIFSIGRSLCALFETHGRSSPGSLGDGAKPYTETSRNRPTLYAPSGRRQHASGARACHPNGANNP